MAASIIRTSDAKRHNKFVDGWKCDPTVAINPLETVNNRGTVSPYLFDAGRGPVIFPRFPFAWRESIGAESPDASSDGSLVFHRFHAIRQTITHQVVTPEPSDIMGQRLAQRGREFFRSGPRNRVTLPSLNNFAADCFAPSCGQPSGHIGAAVILISRLSSTLNPNPKGRNNSGRDESTQARPDAIVGS
jgi:hypothetical protein